MKKKIMILMALVCLVFCFEGMYALAESKPYVICPYCRTELVPQGQHVGDWKSSHPITDSNGKQATCYTTHSVDRDVKYCPKGCGIVWTGDDVESVWHSHPDCPDRNK